MRFPTLLPISVAAAMAVMACSTSDHAGSADDRPPTDVWQLIDRTVAEIPLTVDKMQKMLDTKLTPYRDPVFAGTGPPTRWDGGAVELGQNLTISAVAMAVNDEGRWNFASYDFGAIPCITLDDVRARYPNITLTSRPTGHSANERFVWSAAQPWGTLTFAFPESGGSPQPGDCLIGIALNAPGS
jgi:hypothetical protein